MAPLNAAFAVPGALDTPTGGYAYARAVLARLPAHGIAAAHVALPGSFPHPAETDLVETVRLLSGVPADAALLVDGLAYGAIPPAAIDALARPLVALCHHPLGLEAGLSPARAAALIETERAALARAARVVVTSSATAATLVANFAVPRERIVVAEPGTEPAPRAVGAPAGAPTALLAIGAISPRKGFDLLVAALARLTDRAWRLTLVGPTDRDPATVADLRARIAAAGLGERIALTGALDEAARDAAYAGADVFVSSSLYEGYGMVLAEALARGLPLVASTGGAAADTVPDAAALKVPPGDVDALEAALARILDDAALRARLSDAAWEAGRRLPTWDDATARIAAALHASLETTR